MEFAVLFDRSIPVRFIELETFILLFTLIDLLPFIVLLLFCVEFNSNVCELFNGLKQGIFNPTISLILISLSYNFSIVSNGFNLSGNESGELLARHTRNTTSRKTSVAFWFVAVPIVISLANFP